jgi:hypothetical protein
MSKLKVQIKPKIQMNKEEIFGIQSFGIDLTFELWNLDFLMDCHEE